MATDVSQPLQRRAAIRVPILLPIRIRFVGDTLAKLGRTFALAIDISTGGAQILLDEHVAEHFLREVEVGGVLYVSLIHNELKRYIDVRASVRWSRAAHNGECLLGIAFHTPLTNEAVSQMVHFGRLSPAPSRSAWWGGVAVAAAIVLGLLWFREREALEETVRASRPGEQALDESRKGEQDCRAALERAAAVLDSVRAEHQQSRDAGAASQVPSVADGGRRTESATRGAEDGGGDAGRE